MRNAAFALVVIALMVPATLEAQRRGWEPRGRGQLPPAGLCRVWYDRLPPGRQPAPMSCRQAEQIARRDGSARVIYGSGTVRGRQGVPRYSYPDQFPGRRDSLYGGPAYSIGYKDGYDKGFEDGEDNDRYDPARHGRYRSADHEYEREYGPKEQYRIVYRDGFRAGYDAGYRNAGGPRRRW